MIVPYQPSDEGNVISPASAAINYIQGPFSSIEQVIQNGRRYMAQAIAADPVCDKCSNDVQTNIYRRMCV